MEDHMRAVHYAMWVLLRCAVLAACAPAQAAETMHFVMEPLPPFIVEENGVPAGPFPEVVREACKALKFECTLAILPWRRALAMAEAGQADGIFVFVRTPEREKLFYFTEPILQTSYAIFARQSETLDYHKPQDIDGYTVAAYGPSGISAAAEELAKQLPRLRVIIEVDNLSVLRKLSAGRYGNHGVALVNREAGKYLIEREHLPGLKTVGEVRKIDYVIGLSRKRLTPEQAEHFNGAIRQMIKNGEIAAIAERHGVKAAALK
jgi:polar amino acid transport system substrate-binding protein